MCYRGRVVSRNGREEGVLSPEPLGRGALAGVSGVRTAGTVCRHVEYVDLAVSVDAQIGGNLEGSSSDSGRV